MDSPPKIESVKESAPPIIVQNNSQQLDSVQLRAVYSHVRIGTYAAESFPKCKNRPPIIETPPKCKKNTGPVLRLLKRRQNSTYHSTKSCDNIYAVNRSSNSLDWRLGNTIDHQGFRASQSNSLDWRIGRTVTSCSNQLESQGETRSAEQLSRSIPSTLGSLQASNAKSKLVSFLRRLSPRLSRPSKNSLQSSPVICPWVQVEYSKKSVDDNRREESQESDTSFQQELKINEIRKKIAEHSLTNCAPKTCGVNVPSVDERPASYPSIRIEGPENHCALRSSGSVHNDRGDHRSTVVHSEVAGLETGNSKENCATEVVPGGGNTRATLRLRPLSLAVQPLHYHQLSSDVTGKHFNMTSQESIGSCSLDVDTSASDRSDTAVGSISDKTLHSLSLSCNGELTPSPDILPNGKEDTIEEISFDANKENISNIHHENSEPEQLTAKKPSYLGLACSISGYSGITRYDSKLREGFRSRDTSPGTRLITRDTSPAGFRSSENLSLPTQPPSKSLSISPLAMERQNGFSNGVKEEYKIHTFVETRSSMSTCQGFSEVDKGLPLHNTFADISPVRGNAQISPIKKSPGMVRVVAFSQQNKSFMSNVNESSPKSTSFNISNTSMTEMNMTNGSSMEETFNSSSNSEKSFIQQRVERLYGPGALAQGFFFKRSASKLNTSDCFLNKSTNNNNDVSTDDVNQEESLKSLPVLRHLRPEFRAQLPVVSPRKPTDGSEQVIKSSQRVTSSVQKTEEKNKLSSNTIDLNSFIGRNESIGKLKPNITSLKNIPDQLPAALEVVLPVLEPSASLQNIAKHVQEAVEEKDGHYFIKMLKAETERLLSLAASAEAELAGGDPTVLPEEAAGKLRSAAGKARLLATQKMQQFEGLCQKNINQIPGEEFPTTNEDLAGFWDMVMLQVVQVNELFDQIRRLKDSQWKEKVKRKSSSFRRNRDLSRSSLYQNRGNTEHNITLSPRCCSDKFNTRNLKHRKSDNPQQMYTDSEHILFARGLPQTIKSNVNSESNIIPLIPSSIANAYCESTKNPTLLTLEEVKVDHGDRFIRNLINNRPIRRKYFSKKAVPYKRNWKMINSYKPGHKVVVEVVQDEFKGHHVQLVENRMLFQSHKVCGPGGETLNLNSGLYRDFTCTRDSEMLAKIPVYMSQIIENQTVSSFACLNKKESSVMNGSRSKTCSAFINEALFSGSCDPRCLKMMSHENIITCHSCSNYTNHTDIFSTSVNLQPRNVQNFNDIQPENCLIESNQSVPKIKELIKGGKKKKLKTAHLSSRFSDTLDLNEHMCQTLNKYAAKFSRKKEELKNLISKFKKLDSVLSSARSCTTIYELGDHTSSRFLIVNNQYPDDGINSISSELGEKSSTNGNHRDIATKTLVMIEAVIKEIDLEIAELEASKSNFRSGKESVSKTDILITLDKDLFSKICNSLLIQIFRAYQAGIQCIKGTLKSWASYPATELFNKVLKLSAKKGANLKSKYNEGLSLKQLEVIPDSKAITSLPQNGSNSKRRVNVLNKAKPTANSEANRKAREAREQARRQMIEERRRAMRSNAQNKDHSDADSVKIFVPQT